MGLMRPDVENLLIIGIGGFFGAISRFLLSNSIATPFDTLAVNVIGSFALGMLMFDTELLGYVSPRMRMGLGIGFLGSFTTFSTFAVQSYRMIPTLAVLNITTNVILTLVAVFLGRGAIILLIRKRKGGVTK